MPSIPSLKCVLGILAGVVPGGPADKYDQTHASGQRIEAHDTILKVDGEVATEANILRLLRGDGMVGGSAVILVQKFAPSPLNSAASKERITESTRDPVSVTLHRDYKWWVEGMRDVAVAVEQVSNDMGSNSARSNDEGLMHTVWQMEVNKQLRKLSKLSATSQQNLRNHVAALEDALTSALGNANSETMAVEQQLSLERDELRARLEHTQQQLREQELERELEKRRSGNGGGDAVVVERYREMIGALQHDLQVAQAKNVDLLNQMHQLRLENEKTQAALTDSHSMETRAAFVAVRQVEERGSHALAALKDSQSKAEQALATMALQARALQPRLYCALQPFASSAPLVRL